MPYNLAAKYDTGKSDLWRGIFKYFPKALFAVAQVSMFGARKYAWSDYRNGWMKVPDGFERYTSALGRHVLEEGEGQEFDRESGLLHAAHAAWNALARLELLLDQASKANEKPRVVSTEHTGRIVPGVDYSGVSGTGRYCSEDSPGL